MPTKTIVIYESSLTMRALVGFLPTVSPNVDLERRFRDKRSVAVGTLVVPYLPVPLEVRA